MKPQNIKLLAYLASTLSAIGSVWIFATTKWTPESGFYIGIAFYLAAKACFLGPMLLLVSQKNSEK